ncbi:tRNA (adenosine(37)-N6)-threonylcarbamoyltransferase complex dimerization subunit type 1 TsaB [Capnocytophaga stomatis]|uniref:tRNA (adenosine(37)-N6)-threonylcarbamoyltransferase complex dimerization subunit type 1 TsaB n=1 Tax=Capnocytophaga stomatis TaxID=1848904 RepID=UPI001ACD8C02|nr:tRNA (adenosine(37)-N6)-threonylcarbamoyltransferase complex dimerization subunit type 1 TsaB [Capnocytophaga stomatis]GIM48652.1 tRNA (adenosine(37)-N6)-threonylcarbamoyltransferase complex dimerization subunit type 1 TsaB [Capnocytophaga stomatis]
MTKILCIETSGINCSVAISEGSSLLAEKAENKGKFTHAESLHVFINEVLNLAKISINELDAIAVSGGPGSYTGLRIGVSTAKGLCFALNKPLIAISTLQILASQITDNQLIIPMLDARRMEVYSAVFDKNFNEIEKTEAKILNENSYTEWLSKGKVIFLGDGAEKFSKICHHPNAFFIKNAYPQARDMVVHAFERFKNKCFEDIAYFEPNYLK